MFLIVLLYALCASTFTISKWGLIYSAPLFFVALRMLLAGTLLGAYCLLREELGSLPELFRNVRQDKTLFAQIVIFHIYLTYVCDLCALTSLSTIESAFMYNLSPFIAAACSYFWFSERLSLQKWVGLLMGFGAMLYGLVDPLRSVSLFEHSIPRLVTLLAVASSAYGWVVVRALIKKGYSAIFINAFGMFIGGVLALATSYGAETWDPVPVTDWKPFLHALILLVVIANIIFYNLYGYLLRFYTATFLSFAGFLCPLFVSLFGYLFLGEMVSSRLLVSFFFVCIGLFLFYHEELKKTGLPINNKDYTSGTSSK